MAKGKYSWIMRINELLLPYTFFKLDKYLNKKRCFISLNFFLHYITNFEFIRLTKKVVL